MGGNSTAACSIGGYIGGSSGGAVGGRSGSDLIPSSSILSSTSGISHSCGTSWEEFSDRHARAAAADFAKACITFINGNLTPEQARGLSYRNFGQKFMDSFAEHYETEFLRRRNNLKDGNGTLEEGNNTETHTSKIFHKTFFRRLSFKGLRKGKTFFQKNSDNLEGSVKNKTKLAKIVVECRKEGIVNNLTPESLDQPTGMQKWEKCRLALVKAVGGYMLEFYMPPKATKPRSGVFCFLISEARGTTPLEMPDRENTFVLKADNNMEYVIEAQDTNDMRNWLATIRYCMRTPPTQQPTFDSEVLAAAMQTSQLNPTTTTVHAVQNQYQQQQPGLSSNGNIAPGSSPPENAPSSAIGSAGGGGSSLEVTLVDGNVENLLPDIPPRSLGERGEQRLSSSSNIEACDGTVDNDVEVNVLDITAEMRQYPWFHGTLPRSEAARMVLLEEANGHGYFLVRQSETRKGEFVLTFNFNGRAKHLRMTLSDKGQCRVQHLWFPSIQEMLEHFRHNPIPLESGGTSDVTLTNFIHNQGVPNDMNNLDIAGESNTTMPSTFQSGDIGQAQAQDSSPRHSQDVISMNISVRLKTCEIDLSQMLAMGLVAHRQRIVPQHHPLQQCQSTLSHNSTHSQQPTSQILATTTNFSSNLNTQLTQALTLEQERVHLLNSTNIASTTMQQPIAAANDGTQQYQRASSVSLQTQAAINSINGSSIIATAPTSHLLHNRQTSVSLGLHGHGENNANINSTMATTATTSTTRAVDNQYSFV